jgi:hypothetical protein
MPQPPRPIELEATAIVLGVDHEHPTGPDHQVVDIRPAARDGEVAGATEPWPDDEDNLNQLGEAWLDPDDVADLGDVFRGALDDAYAMHRPRRWERPY